MNLDDKIATKVEEKYGLLLELFQSSDATDADLRRKIQYLTEAVPLIEDIKTEVSDIQRKITNIPPSEDEKDEDEPGRREPPTSYTPDPDEPRLEDLTESLDKEVEKLEYLRQYLEQNNFDNLPDNIIQRLPILEIFKTAVDLTYRMKKYSDILSENISNKANRQIEHSESVKETIINNLTEDVRTLEQLIDQVQQDLNDAIDRLQGQETSDHATTLEKLLNILGLDEAIKQDTSDIKSDTSDIKDGVHDLDDNMSQCCQSMEDGISSVKDDTTDILTGISQLKPSTQSNQSLALMQKMNAALGGLEFIRGLL